MAENKQDDLPVTPSVIQWARERSGFSLEDAAKTFKKIAAWEKGDDAPTYPQLEQMAERFKCPVAVFFFPEPPNLPPVENSFRTLAEDDFAHIPRNVRLMVRKAQAMQLNLAELNDGRNPAERLITRDLSFALTASPRTIAGGLRDYLGVSIEQQSAWGSIEEALEGWRDVFAQVGIYVFKDAFQAERYFGFCLYDPVFPIIYINNSSAKSRQIFTMFHELGHLLFQTSGIDTEDDTLAQDISRDARRIETICNALAAAFLTPDAVFDKVREGMPADRDTAAILGEYFNVSREAIYRKFLDRRLITSKEYGEATELWRKQLKRKSSGGNFYNTHFAYLGPHYIDLAFTRYYQRRIDEVQLSEYLNIKPKNLPAFELKYASGQ